MFNLFYFFTSPLNFGNNSLLRINNAFIEGLNHRDHLPTYVLIILDRDLIDMINRFDYGITTELERCIKWIAIQMERSVSARKDQMWNVKPGSVALTEVKFIWVEMFDRPVIDQAVTICNKFNKGINDMAWQRHNHHILVIESLQNHQHFERNGKLNYWGKLQFWRELDYHIKQFDRKKATLNPRSFTPDHVNGNPHKSMEKRKPNPYHKK